MRRVAVAGALMRPVLNKVCDVTTDGRVHGRERRKASMERDTCAQRACASIDLCRGGTEAGNTHLEMARHPTGARGQLLGDGGA